MRKCGSCTVCCVIVEVNCSLFNKPAGDLCIYCKKECLLFNSSTRPKVCKRYYCGWARGLGTENDRPDNNGVMLSISRFNGGTWIFVMETKKGAYKTTGKNIIEDTIKKIDLPIIVSDFDSKPGSDYGDYVIIKESLQERSKNIRGDFIFEFTEDANVYELNK